MELLLEAAQLARSTYYYHEKRLTGADKYYKVKKVIAAIYHENKGRYGYHRITTELRRRGFLLNHKTVQKLMKELNLYSRNVVSYSISDKPVRSMVTQMLKKAFARISDVILH